MKSLEYNWFLLKLLLLSDCAAPQHGEHYKWIQAYSVLVTNFSRDPLCRTLHQCFYSGSDASGSVGLSTGTKRSSESAMDFRLWTSLGARSVGSSSCKLLFRDGENRRERGLFSQCGGSLVSEKSASLVSQILIFY